MYLVCVVVQSGGSRTSYLYSVMTNLAHSFVKYSLMILSKDLICCTRSMTTLQELFVAYYYYELLLRVPSLGNWSLDLFVYPQMRVRDIVNSGPSHCQICT